MIVAGIFLGFTKVYSLLSLVAAPFATKAIVLLIKITKAWRSWFRRWSTVIYSRITGFLLALSFTL